MVRKGEREIDLRIKMLRHANKASWTAVDNRVTDPLCDNDEDYKRYKKAVREAKEELAESRRKFG